MDLYYSVSSIALTTCLVEYKLAEFCSKWRRVLDTQVPWTSVKCGWQWYVVSGILLRSTRFSAGASPVASCFQFYWVKFKDFAPRGDVSLSFRERSWGEQLSDCILKLFGLKSNELVCTCDEIGKTVCCRPHLEFLRPVPRDGLCAYWIH